VTKPSMPRTEYFLAAFQEATDVRTPRAQANFDELKKLLTVDSHIFLDRNTLLYIVATEMLEAGVKKATLAIETLVEEKPTSQLRAIPSESHANRPRPSPRQETNWHRYQPSSQQSPRRTISSCVADQMLSKRPKARTTRNDCSEPCLHRRSPTRASDTTEFVLTA
jgi:hypothetical protein